MTHDEAVALIKKTRLVAILRGIPAELSLPVADALCAGGVRALEFTFNHADPDCLQHNCDCIRTVCRALGKDVLVGCGTVLTTAEVEGGVEAGARLMISPNVNVDVIRRSRELGAVSMPGALTPTEIVYAHQSGADIVKLFPAGTLGVGYLRALQGPLGFIPMSAVGGVRPETVHDFLDAGVCGFGVGGELTRAELLERRDFAGLTARAREFVDAIASWEAH